MNKRNLRILAIVALGFMAIFTVTFVMFLVDRYMWGGAVAFIALFSGAIGVILFFIVRMYQKKEEEIRRLTEQMEKDASAENPEGDKSEAENIQEPDKDK